MWDCAARCVPTGLSQFPEILDPLTRSTKRVGGSEGP
jgi:hypothetical protein